MLSSQSLQPATTWTRTSVECGRPILEAHTVIAVSGRILFQVGLVPFLGRIKGIHSVNRCMNRLLVVRLDLTRIDEVLQLGLDLGGNLLLLVIIAKDNGRILWASIVSLTVHGRRVVELKEELDEVLKVGGGIIEFDVEDFNVTRSSGAHLAVGRIQHSIFVGRHETDFGFFDRIGKLFLEVDLHILFSSCLICKGKQAIGRVSWLDQIDQLIIYKVGDTREIRCYRKLATFTHHHAPYIQAGNVL
jgi:hypothetical protein